MISSSPPSPSDGINRLIEAGKAGELRHEFLYTHPYAHEARLLFFSVLDEEWPDLKHDLFHRCWRLFQEACAPLAGAPASCVWTFEGGQQFNMPGQLHDFRHLCVSGDFPALRREFVAWGKAAGRGIQDEWFLESAFFTLRTVSPVSKGSDYDGADQAWRYPFERTFPHRWPQPLPQVDITAPPRTLNKIRRIYRKQNASRFEVPKEMSSDHARWTVARLSDRNLSWGRLGARFPQLQRYSEGVSEAKRRVRKFAEWIDLTLADTRPERRT